MCRQTWYPRNDSRGYGLYGSQFMPRYCGKRAKRACCCTSDLCQKIGYSHMGMMCLPINCDKCIETITVLGIDPKNRQQIADNPKHYRVAPWHYSPRHRICDKGSGQWTFRKFADGKKYIDDDQTKFNIPPPNYSLQRFIDEEMPSFGYSGGGVRWFIATMSEEDGACRRSLVATYICLHRQQNNPSPWFHK